MQILKDFLKRVEAGEQLQLYQVWVNSDKIYVDFFEPDSTSRIMGDDWLVYNNPHDHTDGPKKPVVIDMSYDRCILTESKKEARDFYMKMRLSGFQPYAEDVPTIPSST